MVANQPASILNNEIRKSKILKAQTKFTSRFRKQSLKFSKYRTPPYSEATRWYYAFTAKKFCEL